MKTLGQIGYESQANRYREICGSSIPLWEQIPIKSQLVWEKCALDIRAAVGPFRDVDLTGQKQDFARAGS